MSPQRIAGVILLVVGVALLIIGLNSSESVSDQVSEAITGRFTQATIWYIVGGIASSVLGLILVLVGVRGHKG